MRCGERRVQDLLGGFRFQGSEFRVQGAGCRVQGSGFRVQVSKFRVQGSGFRIQGLKIVSTLTSKPTSLNP